MQCKSNIVNVTQTIILYLQYVRSQGSKTHKFVCTQVYERVYESMLLYFSVQYDRAKKRLSDELLESSCDRIKR